MRKGKAPKRHINGDSRYNNKLVAKFINNLMFDGKKTSAERVMYNAFDLISKKEQDPLEVFEKALQNVAPKQEVRARRVGGANYQVPAEVRGERKVSLSIRWIIEAAKKRPNKEFHKMEEKLAAEFLDAIENKGEAIKKRDSIQRMADANRAFSHFRW